MTGYLHGATCSKRYRKGLAPEQHSWECGYLPAVRRPVLGRVQAGGAGAVDGPGARCPAAVVQVGGPAVAAVADAVAGGHGAAMAAAMHRSRPRAWGRVSGGGVGVRVWKGGGGGLDTNF